MLVLRDKYINAKAPDARGLFNYFVRTKINISWPSIGTNFSFRFVGTWITDGGF